MVVLLVTGRAGVLERGVKPRPVVPAFDEAEDGRPCGAARGPDVRVDQLRLEGGEEALRHRVDAPIVRQVVVGSFRRSVRTDATGENPVDLSSDIALQAADDLFLAQTLLGPPLDVLLSAR